ncbi:YjbH domain-containing protein [bacterium]|nr:YjbH domain-containing protein [bacterium]
MRSVFILLLSFLFFSGWGRIEAQEAPSSVESVRDALIRLGFENVAAYEDSADLAVTYENRIYRYEIKAVREIFKLVPEFQLDGKRLILIPQKRGIPVAAIVVDPDRGAQIYRAEYMQEKKNRAKIEVNMDVEPYWKRLDRMKPGNSSFMKIDFYIHPQFKAQLGNFRDAVQSQINLAPAVSTSLWKGMRFSVQWIFPLQNDLGPEGDDGRPGFVTLNQTLRLPFRSFLSGSLGYFSQNRYGVDLEIKKFWCNGQIAAAADLGYTGFAQYYQNGWYYSDPGWWTYFFSVEARSAVYDFTARLTCGKFIYRDSGFRLDVLRQFGEIAVGFFALKTGEGTNGGFSFNIPLFPSKRGYPRRFRVSPAVGIPFSYRYKGLPQYGLQYSTSNGLDEFLENLNPDFIGNQLRKSLID